MTEKGRSSLSRRGDDKSRSGSTGRTADRRRSGEGRRASDKKAAGFDVRMLAAALLAATVVVGVSLAYKIGERRDQVRDSSLDLARQLVALPSGMYAQNESSQHLAQVELKAHIQRLLDYQTHDPYFAYAGVYNAAGEVLARTVAPGVTAPVAIPVLTGSWVQNVASESQTSRVLHSLVGPIQNGGDGGFYRIGFFEPALEVAYSEFGFLAAVTLPVFLFALSGLALMRRAFDPLRGLNQQLDLELGTEQEIVPAASTKSAAGDMDAFVSQFNRFMEQAQGRIDEYQKERDTMATSERFLHYRLNRFEAMLHALPDGVVVLDDSRQLTFANDRALRLFDLDRVEIAGQRLSAVLQSTVDAGGQDKQLQILQVWCRQFEANKTTNMPEPLSFRPADTGTLVLTCSAHAVAGQTGGEPTGYLLIIADTTREALAQQKRAEFVAHVSHELKSPLNTLGMCVETLKTPVDEGAVDAETDAEFRLEAVNIIGDEVERLAALISNLLNITQIEMGNMEPDRTRVRLAELVQDVFTSTRRSATDSTLKFELDVPGKIPAVLIDKDLMRIALNNLVTNAIKYSNPEGVIRVSIVESDEAISISVQDSGIGIPLAEQTSIFNKFYRSEDQVARARGGQGLGLSLAQEIVQMHHGAIRVESEPGVGSTFTIDLWKNAEIVQQAI